MKTADFLKVAPKITESNLFSNLKKGAHGRTHLGVALFGSTDSHYEYIWRKYGTLANLICLKTSDEVNEILKEFRITEFIAIPTKSKTMCRLKTVI